MICEKDKCTGCFACYNICPKGAIEMKEDEFGYIYPKIIESKCINCGLCKKTCPVLNKVELKKPIKCLAIRTLEKNILNKSSSGGIATIISKKVLENSGIVYGASFMNSCEVNHIRIENKEDLNKIQGSKYVHSYIKDTYKNVKKDLIADKNVLFIGTPCQIAGLKRYLMKDYKKLYTIDIICHGVPSQKFLKDEIFRINKDLNIDRVNFRDKKYNPFHFTIVKNGGDTFFEIWTKSPYFYTFMKSFTYRDNCYTCRYAGIERCSDMTIGDFWGISKESKFYNTRSKGISVALPITEKGTEMLELIYDCTEFEERDINEAVAGNDQLRDSCKKSQKEHDFKKSYLKTNNFYKSYKKVFKKNYYKQIIKSNKFVSKILDIKKELKNGKKK